MKKLILIPRFYYEVVRLFLFVMMLQLFSTLNMSFSLGYVKELSPFWNSFCYYVTLAPIVFVLYKGTRCLWNIYKIGLDELAKLRREQTA